MSTRKPPRGRPNDKIRRAVAAYFELTRADRLVEHATMLQGEALKQFNTATSNLTAAEMERYITLVEKQLEDD